MELTYQLIRSRKRKKTISLTVKPGGVVVIQAPYAVPRGEIDGFFHRKLPWIRQKLSKPAPYTPRDTRGNDSFAAGDRVMFLGLAYPVIIAGTAANGRNLSFDGERFIVSPDTAAAGRDSLRAWYRQAAALFLPERVKVYEEMTGYYSHSVRISLARSRWGSCSPDNRLAFSWRLMMAPTPVIDYVVVHELAHIREKNHSPRFWSLVGKICPDYKDRRRWLRVAGSDLFR